ncbi:hypothetical protein TIN4_37 [Tsukamurella phage TIN4]|uniref:Uncharacterized protein n=2 Tax=Tinduovirus TIN3 TaxID=1982571 RepID=A0A0K0N621_9CAUD|nr:endonuclease [Tsukamurella phage TIN3]YP_009604167.1 endonuclease [Tsukamurella phage TIN4]AKJ71834.1 hypothetical protein TIN3_37 [Tsukamurella phage TIN3]AKJ71943.1 hypothetical protein TIN4_37 [Tsukamurella phage TIN4]
MADKPAGPYELNPIKSVGEVNYTDFRPIAPEQTAFQQHMQQTAFTSEQRAEADAKSDADELFGTGEPQTAFELEARGGRAPLGAQASADPSLFDQVQTESDPSKTLETNASAEKESKPQAPSAPTRPSTSSPKSGPVKPSV